MTSEQKGEFAEYLAGNDSLVDAFVALTDAPQRQKRVLRHQTEQLHHVLLDLLKLYRELRSVRTENGESVLRVALQLLHHQAVDASLNPRSIEMDQVQVALLQLVMALRPWLLECADNTAPVLVELLFQVQVPYVEVLKIIMKLADVTSSAGIAAIQETLLACTSRTPEVLAVSQRWRERGLHAVDENTLPAVAELLRDGTNLEQELVLLSLLPQRRRVREHLVLHHGGAEPLAKMARGEGNAGSKEFALAIVEELAVESVASREEMLRFWLHEQFAAGGSMQKGKDVFLLALRSRNENFVGESVMRTLRDGVQNESYSLMEQCSLAEYLCKYRNLVEEVSTRLTVTMYDGEGGHLQVELWPLLLEVLERLRREDCAVYPQVVVDTSIATATALLVLEVEDEEPFWEMAVRTLRSCIRITEANCEVISDRGVIPMLVRLLAVQSTNTLLGQQLVGLLRDIAAASRLAFAAEINQVVISLCSDRRCNDAAPFSLATPVYFQNLLLVYRDIPEMKLGVATGIDQAIAVGAAAELLSARTSEIDKVIAMNYLHDELGLHECDPLRCHDANSVTWIVSDKVVGIIGIAMDGPEDARLVARRILTALAVSNSAVAEKVRKYQFLEPPIVMPELLDVWQREHLESLEPDEQMYEYNNSDDSEDGETVGDGGDGDGDSDDTDNNEDSNQFVELGEQKMAEKPEKREDEWELV